MIIVQIIFLYFKIESFDELKVIFLFHLIGLSFELFKTHPSIAAWSYPEPGFFKISTVPLYSGFMYSAVASFIIQAWRLLKLKVVDAPPLYVTIPLAFIIYAHFFLRHYGVDLRWILVAGIFVIYLQTDVFFTVIKNKTRKMKLALSFALISFFLWIAENISTFLGAWQYPHQTQQWSLVHDTKISAWFLFFIISFIVVVDLKILRKKLSMYNRAH